MIIVAFEIVLMFEVSHSRQPQKFISYIFDGHELKLKTKKNNNLRINYFRIRLIYGFMNFPHYHIFCTNYANESTLKRFQLCHGSMYLSNRNHSNSGHVFEITWGFSFLLKICKMILHSNFSMCHFTSSLF